MKKHRCTIFFILSFAVCLSILSCNNDTTAKTDQKDQEILKEAAKIHNEAINIGLALAPQLEQFRQTKNSINIQGRALTPVELKFVEKVDRLNASHNYWQQHLIEVPGFGHDHSHDHAGHDHSDHSHQHSSGPDLSADQMLQAQQDIRDSILMIQQQVKVIVDLSKEL